MKILKCLLTAALIFTFTSCSIFSPGKKEFFQKEVPAYPQKTKVEEDQRVAADFVAKKLTIAVNEAEKNQITNTVLEPIKEAHSVAGPLADSLGHPVTPHIGAASNLVAKIDKDESKYEAALRKLEVKLTTLEGKDIEGTGAIQIGYFTYIGILLIVASIGWFILKLLALSNPPLALGTQVVSAGASLLRRGFTEVVSAGEKFKDMLKKKVEDPETQQQILDLFRQAHLEVQSADTQQVIKTLTNDPNNPKGLVKELVQKS